jgi:hypothetical protein
MPTGLNQHPIPKIAMAKKWMQGAVKHPGALHRTLGVPAGKKIPAKLLARLQRAQSADAQASCPS